MSERPSLDVANEVSEGMRVGVEGSWICGVALTSSGGLSSLEPFQGPSCSLSRGIVAPPHLNLSLP